MGKKKTNFQKWIANMKKYPPGKVQAPIPSPKDSGKVLAVGKVGRMTWVPPQGGGGGGGGLPDITEDDVGKVLTVNDSAEPAWGLGRPWVMDPMAK
jgi:hypothetical protein